MVMTTLMSVVKSDIMKIELKNIKHMPSLSEETEAFSANLYINDVKAGIGSNGGRGEN